MAGTNNTLCQTFVADFDPAVTRYYAVSYANGSDGNIGYSDVSMTAAGVVAVKTLTRLRKIVPPVGNGCKIVIAIQGNTDGTSRTYYKPDGVTVDDLDLRGLTGYGFVLVRTTQNFVNDTSDKTILAPAQGQVGPNGDGSFTVIAGATVSSMTISAGTLTAEPGILGMRVRFTGNVTAALANQSRMIWKNTGTVITPGRDFPVAPANGDTFYVERPGVIVDNIFTGPAVAGMGTDQGQSQSPLTVVGLRVSQSTVYAYFWGSLSGRASFIECDKLWSIRDTLRFTTDYQYVDEGATLITTGCGIRHDQQRSIIISDGLFISWKDCFTQSTTNTSYSFSRALAYNIGAGCVFYNSRLQLIASGLPGDASSNTFGPDTTTIRRSRFTGVNGSTTVAPLTFSGGTSVRISGLDISNAIAVPCIAFQTCCKSFIRLRDIVSTDGGNTSYVIDLTFGGGTTQNSSFRINPTGVTITAALGDIKDPSGVVMTFAQVLATHTIDTLGNDYGSTAGTDQPITRRSPGIFYNGPILGADPATLIDGDVWITNIAGVKNLCVRIAGATVRSLLV